MGLMSLSKCRFIPKGRYFPPNTDIKTEADVRRERNVALLVVVLMVLLSVGIPFLANMGKTIFGIEPIIY